MLKTDYVRSLSVLIADDDSEDKELFAEALSGIEGQFELSSVANGQELIDHLLGRSPDSLPDVIFLDLNMPIKDGREALKEIKGTEHLKGIPVIVFSTSNSITDINQSYSYGANLFIVKPFEFSSLIKILDTSFSFLTEVVRLPQAGKYANGRLR